MRALVWMLWLAGLVQLAIVAANFFLPKKLGYRESLSHAAPIIRQIFMVHSAYIVGIVLFFAVLTLAFAPDLAGGHGLGRFLAGALALFWLCRVPLQLFYYDAALRRANRAGDIAMTTALVFLGVTYAAAAVAPSL